MRRLHALTLLLAAAALALLTGCASTPAPLQSLQQQWPAHLPERVDLADTPFVAQQDFECGPAALAMLLQAAGRPVDAEQLKPQVFLPGRQGSLQQELLVAARRNGLPAYRLPPRLDALLAETAAGHPVLVFMNLSLPIYPVWHYAVVIGYDRQRETVLLHSGTEAHQEWPLAQFERTWARGEHWAMLALPPEQLPASLDGAAVAQALAALERLQAPAARRGYAAALQRWPQQAALLLGAGNSAYAGSDLPAAQAAYRRLTETHPDLPEGWNNLAQVLLEQGRRDAAAQAIAQAVQRGGPRLAQYQALQQRIAATR